MATKYEELIAAEVTDDEDEEPGDEETPPDEGDDSGEAADEEEPAAPTEAIDPKALESELRRHERAMQKLLGDAFPDMAPCPTCEGMGFTPDRREPLPDMLADPFAEACPDCAGRGLVKLPSFREGQTERSCQKCDGNGWLPKDQAAGLAAMQAPAYVAPNGSPSITPAEGIDPATIQRLREAGYVVSEPLVTMTSPLA